MTDRIPLLGEKLKLRIFQDDIFLQVPQLKEMIKDVKHKVCMMSGCLTPSDS